MRAILLALLVTACSSGPSVAVKPDDGGDDAQAVVSITVCEVGEPCAGDAGTD